MVLPGLLRHEPDALQDFLPLEVTLDVKTVRYDTLKVAKRLEAELGDEQHALSKAVPAIGTSCLSLMGHSR